MWCNQLLFPLIVIVPWLSNSFHIPILSVPHPRVMRIDYKSDFHQKTIEHGRSRKATHMSVAVADVVHEPLSPAKNPTTTSSFAALSTSLVKNCVGAGVFSITAKMVAISADKQTVIKASGLIALMSIWAAYNFWIIGETCAMSDSTTYGESWGKTVSKNTAWITQAIVLLSPIVSCLANTIVLTDVLKSLLIGFGFPAWMSANRNVVIGLLGSTILFPLCSLKDLSALKSVSAFGIAGQLLSMVVLFVRFLDKSYFPGGKFFVNAAANSPALITAAAGAAAALPVDPMKWFVFASLLSYCFVTHYNAPRFYNEMKDVDSSSFLKLAGTSFSLAGLVYIVTMTLGWGLFGANAKPFLLNNLLSSDPLALIARASFGASVLASTPLIFLSMRNWVVTQLSKRTQLLSGIRPVTALLLSIICGLAVVFSDISVVGSISGAVFGSSMMFIFPPIMYIRALMKRAELNNTAMPKTVIVGNLVLLLCGAILGVLGSYNSISTALRMPR